MTKQDWPKLGLGSVGTFKGHDFVEADDEAFISSDGEDPDYEIAVKGPEALRVARLIVAAVDLLRAAQIAEQFMSVASDRNFDECEIDGDMKRTHALRKIVLDAIAKATHPTP